MISSNRRGNYMNNKHELLVQEITYNILEYIKKAKKEGISTQDIPQGKQALL